jgi:hypothetical protein
MMFEMLYGIGPTPKEALDAVQKAFSDWMGNYRPVIPTLMPTQPTILSVSHNCADAGATTGESSERFTASILIVYTMG